jgi:hypothetical protein
VVQATAQIKFTWETKKVLVHLQSDTIPNAAAGITKRLNQSRHETRKPTNNNPKLNTNKRRDQQTYFHAANPSTQSKYTS